MDNTRYDTPLWLRTMSRLSELFQTNTAVQELMFQEAYVDPLCDLLGVGDDSDLLQEADSSLQRYNWLTIKRRF